LLVALFDKITYPLGIWLQAMALAALPPLSRHRRRTMFAALSSLRRKLPIVSVEQLLAGMPDAETVHVRAVEMRPHNMTTFELFTIAAITSRMKPELAVEIGTFDGRGTMAIAANTTGRIYTINLPPDFIDLNPAKADVFDVQLSRKVVSGERLLAPEKNHVVQLFADSTKLDFEQFRGAGLIFIDGGHTYEVVKSDTEKALQVIDRQSGMILWHDADALGVGEYLPQVDYPVYQIDGTVLAVLLFRDGRPVEFA
jgi:predicted O-methyltransferase YrrM